MYQRRLVDSVLDAVFPALPAVLLDGPKAVGKTTTATQRAKTIRNLQDQGEQALAESDPNWLLAGHRPLLIDEWQMVPQSWSQVKQAVDKDFSGGQFLLTGSLPNFSTHSGAGRITAIRMRPLSFAERSVAEASISFAGLLAGNAEVSGESTFVLADYIEEITRSGFFGIRGLEGRALGLALSGYLERVVDSDLPEMGVSTRKPASLRAWLASYAAATGTVAKWETIRDSANPGSDQPLSRDALIPYRDALTRLRILDELPPWVPTRNEMIRVGSASKHLLADPALALNLLSLDAKALMEPRSFETRDKYKPLVGRMFEALVALSVRVYAEAEFAKAMHFRDYRGDHEVDLVVEREDGKLLAIEVKLASTIQDRDLKPLRWFASQVGDELIDSVVLYTGRHAYRKDGVAIIPFSMLGA